MFVPVLETTAVRRIPERINLEFGAWVKSLRLARGLSLRAARIRTGIDHVSLSGIEDGYVPRIEQVLKLAEGYEIEPNEALERAGYARIRPSVDEALDVVIQSVTGQPVSPKTRQVVRDLIAAGVLKRVDEDDE